MSGSGEMEKRTLIALGGLLHDIGKFVQRARDKGLDKLEDIDLNSEKGLYEEEFRYEHAYLSKVFLDFLEKARIIKNDIKDKLIRYGVKHHRPTNELESVISQVADWYSSSERENKMGSCINLLHSVFERVSLKPKEERKKDAEEYSKWNIKEELNCESLKHLVKDAPLKGTFGFYRLDPLSPEADIFPKTFEGAVFSKKAGKHYEFLIVPESFDKKIIDGYEKAYLKLFNNFVEEIKQLKAVELTQKQFLNYIYYLLYKYTWCVPASTYDTEKQSRHYPDISLFDHSRVLSAIAVAIHDWATANGKSAEDIKPKGRELPTDSEEVFLLVEGDIGGIQNFIYNIHKTSESELSIAKALRGRSFFLSMLSEVFVRYILKELNYPITNALYIGGGKFQLLLANTKNNTEKLLEIEKQINRWMHREFQGELSISIAFVCMKGSALRERNIEDNTGENNEPKTYLDHVEWLQLELDSKKKKKFDELIFEDFDEEKDPTSAENICPSCRTFHKERNKDLCQWCHMSEKWGSVLPKVRYIAFDWGEDKNVEIDNRKTMKFRNFGTVYLLEEGDLEKVKDLPEILNIENTCMKFEENKIVNGFKFIGHSAPKAPEDKGLLRYLNELWQEKQVRSENVGKENLNQSDILPFDLLVEFAQGDKKLGFFRADVDFLGLILSDGLRFNELGDEEIYTISRMATLSRMLDLFFAGYLNRLAEEVSLEYVSKSLEHYRELESQGIKLSESDIKRRELLEKVYQKNKLRVSSLIYTVYSGGDDLFIIAPYDLALEFAKRLREDFRKFACMNPDFGLSGGIYIGRHSTPIHLVAEFAGGLEKLAKGSREVKDSIALFGKPLSWDKKVEESLYYKGLLIRKNKEDGSERSSFTLEETRELAGFLEKLLREERVSRSLLYKFLQLHNKYIEEKDGEWFIDPKIYPKLYYYITRNTKEDVKKELIDALLNGKGGSIDVKNLIINLDVALYIALMKTRKGGE